MLDHSWTKPPAEDNSTNRRIPCAIPSLLTVYLNKIQVIHYFPRKNEINIVGFERRSSRWRCQVFTGHSAALKRPVETRTRWCLDHLFVPSALGLHMIAEVKRNVFPSLQLAFEISNDGVPWIVTQEAYWPDSQ
jgi:hypothetical protein